MLVVPGAGVPGAVERFWQLGLRTGHQLPIATKLTSDRLVDDSPRDTKNTKPPSETITKPTASQNTLMKRAIPSAL